MASRKTDEKTVIVSVPLPQKAYEWIECAADWKGIPVGEHIKEWIVRSLEPWSEEEDPLPLDAYDVGKPIDTGPKREDFPDQESYLKAEKADRIARGLATRKKNREANPPPIADHIKAIVAARKLHPNLSLRQFAQLLYDHGIYASGHSGGKGHPVHSSTLSVWLKEAREGGLLPVKAMPKRAPKTITYPRKP